MSVIGGLGQPAEDPTKLADPAETIGLDPGVIGLDRPADGRLNDDFDLLIAEQLALRGESRPEGQSEVSPAELIVAAIDSPTLLADDVLGDVPASLIERPEPMVVDLSEPIVVDAPEVAAALIDNQVIEIVEIVDNPSVDFDPMPDPVADSLIDRLGDLMKETDDAASDITDNLKG